MTFEFAQISYEEFTTSFIRPATLPVSNRQEPRYHGAFDDMPHFKVKDTKEDFPVVTDRLYCHPVAILYERPDVAARAQAFDHGYLCERHEDED
ncbi:hypothetical protein A0H81_11024 [Grifola frondosa]|uniref:Uncharacterized protein n=1 Tax=Grifola frondosa TaxID=5627 RepID=A0A1C7LWB8_GRIFR|nr:hypothetical protein A0H81_11024 [Grifola frondosa]